MFRVVSLVSHLRIEAEMWVIILSLIHIDLYRIVTCSRYIVLMWSSSYRSWDLLVLAVTLSQHLFCVFWLILLLFIYLYSILLSLPHAIQSACDQFDPVSVLHLELAAMRRDVQSWRSVIGGNVGRSGVSPNNLFIKSINLDTQKGIADSKILDKDAKGALTLLSEQGPDTLWNGTEDWTCWNQRLVRKCRGNAFKTEIVYCSKNMWVPRSQSADLLGDALLCPMFPPTTLRQLRTSLLIIASSRRSTLTAPISESDGHMSRDCLFFCAVTWCSLPFAFLSPFHHSSSFSSFYYFNSNFWYIDMHPTLAGLYPFLLGSPARCAFLLYLCLYIYLGSPARSRLSRSTVVLTRLTFWKLIGLLVQC